MRVRIWVRVRVTAGVRVGVGVRVRVRVRGRGRHTVQRALLDRRLTRHRPVRLSVDGADGLGEGGQLSLLRALRRQRGALLFLTVAQVARVPH